MLSSILIDRENSFPKTEGDDARRPFRSKTLSLLQANFKNRDELKSQGEKYQGLVAYIAGLYRVSDFLPFSEWWAATLVKSYF